MFTKFFWQWITMSYELNWRIWLISPPNNTFKEFHCYIYWEIWFHRNKAPFQDFKPNVDAVVMTVLYSFKGIFEGMEFPN